MNINAYIGRIATDLELKTTTEGTPVLSFNLAVKRPYSKVKTDFIRCVAWGSNAEFVSKYFQKGQTIAVNGYLTSRQYEDKDGNKRTAYEVICDRCEFCESKAKEAEPSYMPDAYKSEIELEEVAASDDLPF